MTLSSLTGAILLAVTALASAYCGWLLGRSRGRARLRERKAYEDEMVRSAALGRERARQEREEIEQRLTRLQLEHVECGERARALESEIRERDTALEQLQVEIVASRQALAESTRLAERLQLRSEEASAPEWLSCEGDGEFDDLQSIRGLGPVLEQRLHELGVRRFHQLASMREADVEWLASRLRILPGRIHRERWADQAREKDTSKHGKDI